MTDDLESHFRAARRYVVKWHHFFPVYERLLSKYRGRAVTLVEVGVGEGGSLEAWRGYLGPSARIIGIDVNPAAERLRAGGFEIIVGDQSNAQFWVDVGRHTGPIDVLIDDGGHTSVDQIVTVAGALPHVRDGGVIVVEDTHTSYMPLDYPAAARSGFMQFAAHVVDAMHSRNPSVTTRIADREGLARAIHNVEFLESLAIFHVDRRQCGPSRLFEAGEPAAEDERAVSWREVIIDQFQSQPRWVRVPLWPLHWVLGSALRAGVRRARARRVSRYFS